MAGLAAAARARELGVDTRVLEKGDRPGGSMLISSCVIWRYRSLDEFRRQCPGGDPALQSLIVERLDDALDWLESLGARVTQRATENPLTVGRRFDPRSLTDALVRAAGAVRMRSRVRTLEGPTILATGGFPVRLARERKLLVRSNRWSEGDGLDLARALGASVAGALDEFYGRALPAPPARVGEDDYVRLAQLYGRFAVVVAESGEAIFEGEPSWAETDLVQTIARWRDGRAWYVVDASGLERTVRGRTVREMIDAAREAGATVQVSDQYAYHLPPSPKLEAEPFTAVLVQASVTHTLGGLRVDPQMHVLRDDGSVVPELFAAGVDVGGVATGGYASGLAQALVLGRIAAETAAAEAP